jgi:hypothetical protein
MPRAIRIIAITLGALTAVAVAVFVITRNEEIARHEHRVQAAYDSGRINRVRYQSASEPWQKGWNWQMNTEPFAPNSIPCADKLARRPIPKEEFEAFFQSDLVLGCSSAQLQRSSQRGMDSDEAAAYTLGFYGLTR